MAMFDRRNHLARQPSGTSPSHVTSPASGRGDAPVAVEDASYMGGASQKGSPVLSFVSCLCFFSGVMGPRAPQSIGGIAGCVCVPYNPLPLTGTRCRSMELLFLA